MLSDERLEEIRKRVASEVLDCVPGSPTYAPVMLQELLAEIDRLRDVIRSPGPAKIVSYKEKSDWVLDRNKLKPSERLLALLTQAMYNPRGETQTLPELLRDMVNRMIPGDELAEWVEQYADDLAAAMQALPTEQPEEPRFVPAAREPWGNWLRCEDDHLLQSLRNHWHEGEFYPNYFDHIAAQCGWLPMQVNDKMTIQSGKSEYVVKRIK